MAGSTLRTTSNVTTSSFTGNSDLIFEKTCPRDRTIFLRAPHIINQHGSNTRYDTRKESSHCDRLLTLANSVVFLFELTLSPQQLEQLFFLARLIPNCDSILPLPSSR